MGQFVSVLQHPAHKCGQKILAVFGAVWMGSLAQEVGGQRFTAQQKHQAEQHCCFNTV